MPQPLLYKDVKDIYARAQQQMPDQFGTQSLADFSKFMQGSQTDYDYGAGTGGENWVKNANLWLDKYVGPESMLGTTAGHAGRDLANLVGVNPEPVQQVFAGLPRTTANFAPYSVPYVGPALTGVLAGTEAYTNTDSVGQGLLQGGLAAAIPQAGIAARTLGTKAIGALTSRAVSTPLGEMAASTGGAATGFAERAAEYLAEMTGITAANKAVGVGTDLATGQDWTRQFSPEAMLGDVAGVAAFAPVAGLHALKALPSGARSYTEEARMKGNVKTERGTLPTSEEMRSPEVFGASNEAIATSYQASDLPRYKSILGTLTPYGPQFGTVEERDAAQLKMDEQVHAEQYGMGTTPMQMLASQNEAYRASLQDQIAERSQALADVQKQLSTKGMSALDQARLEAKKASHVTELARLEQDYQNGMPTLETAAQSVAPILQRTYGMNPPSPGQMAMMTARSVRGMNVANSVISRAEDARAARSAIGPSSDNPLAHRGLESSAGAPPSGQMGLNLNLSDPLDRPYLQERVAGERVRELQSQVAQAAQAEPGNPTAIKALATVIHTDPEMARDTQLKLFSDEWIRRQLEQRSNKEGTPAAQALEETVRGAANVVSRKVEDARGKMNKIDTTREGMAAKVAAAKAIPLPHTPEVPMAGARSKEALTQQAGREADISQLNPVEAKAYVRHSDILSSPDAEQFPDVAQRIYDGVFLGKKDSVDLSTPEGNSEMRNALRSEVRKTRAKALAEQGGAAGLERTQLVEGRDTEADHNLGKGLKEPLSEMDVSTATSSDEGAVRAEKAEKYVGQIRALLRNLEPEDLSIPANRAMSDHIKRATILFDYLSQNTDQIHGQGKAGLNLKAINEAWKQEGVGYKNLKNVSQFMMQDGPFKNIMKEVGDGLGVKFMGVDSNGLGLAGAILRAGMERDPNLLKRLGYGRGTGAEGSGVSAMLNAAELSNALLRTGKYSPTEAKYYGQFLFNLHNLFPQLGRAGVKFTTLIDDLNEGSMGLYLPFKSVGMKSILALSDNMIVKDKSDFARTIFQTGATVLHEAWHGVTELDGDNPVVKRAYDLINTFEPHEQKDLLNAVFKDLADSMKLDLEARKGFSSMIDHSVAEDPTGEGTLGTLAGMLSMHLALPDQARGPSRVIANIIQYLPQPVADLMFRFVARARDVVQSLAGTFGIRDKIPQAVKEFQGIFRELASDRARLDHARVQVENMQNLDPTRFWMNVAQNGIAPIAESEKPTGSFMKAAVQDLDGEKIGHFAKTFETFANQMERYPLLRQPWDSILNYREVVNTVSQLSHMMLADNVAGDQFDFKKLAGNIADEKYNNGFNKLALDLKDNRDKGTPLLDPANPDHNRSVYEKYGTAAGLTGDKLQHFVDFNDRVTHLGVFQGQQWVKDVMDSNAYGVQRLLTLDGMPYKEAYANAARLVTAVDKSDVGAIKELGSTLPQGSFQKALEFALQTNGLVEQMRSTIENNFGYRTEMRLGKYFTHWTTSDGKPGGLGFDTKAQATAHAEKMALQGATDVKVGEKTLFNQGTEGVNKDVVNMVAGMEATRNATLAKLLPPGTALPEEPYSITAALQAEMLKAKTQPLFRPAKAAPGREELNMIDGTMHLARTLPNVFGSRQLRRQQSAMLDDATFRANPDLLARGRQAIQNELTPDGAVSRAVRNFAFSWLMAGNVSSLFVNSLESLQKIPTLLIKDGSSLLSSYGHYFQGMKTALGYILPGGSKVAAPSQEHLDLIKHLEHRGFVQSNIFDLGHNNADLQFINMRRAAMGKNPIESTLDLAKYPIVQLNNMFRMMMTGSEKIGQITSGIAGFEAAKKANPDASRASLYAAAERMAGLGTSIGGKANRPDYLSRIPGIGGILTMQNYELGVLGMVARVAKDAFKRGDQSPAEQVASIKSLLHFAGSTVATAGVMGLPLAGAAIAGMETLFPNLQINASIRKAAAKIFDDDADTGHVVSGMVLKGGLSTMLGTDVSGRLGLGGVLGLNEENGFDIKQMLGPGLNIAKQFVDGVGLISEGKTNAGVLKLLPNSVGNFIRAYQQGGMATTQEGKAVTPLSGYEEVMRSVGFRPKALSDAQDALNMEAKANKIYATQHGVEVKALADEFQAGNYNLVRQGAEQLFANDPTHLPTETMKEVVATVMDRVIPADPLRTAKRATDIVGTFPNSRGQISEQARAQMQMEMLSMLGLHANPPGVQQSMIDAIRSGQDPMSLFEAQMRLKTMQGRRVY